MARGEKGLPTDSIVVLILMVVIGIFLFGKFFVKDADEWEFRVPTETCTGTGTNQVCTGGASGVALTLLQLLIVGAMTLVVFALAPRFGMSMGKRDAYSLVIVAILAFFIYKYVAEPILTAESLSDIGEAIGLKLGLL